MNRINGFGLLLAGLMVLNVALPVCAEGAATAPETTTQEAALETTAPVATAAPATPAAEKEVKAPAFSWLQSLTNGFNAIKSFFIPKVLSDTKKVITGVEKAAGKFENAASKAGEAVTGAANEVKAGMQEIRGVVAGAKQMFAHGLAATKLDGLMKDESVQTLKQHAPLIFGVTVIGAALFAAAWMFKAELETLAGPVAKWLMGLGAPAPVAQ